MSQGTENLPMSPAMMAVTAKIALARQHPEALTAARFRFLQERVKQRYGRTLDPQAAAMVVAVDRYRHKHGKWQ